MVQSLNKLNFQKIFRRSFLYPSTHQTYSQNYRRNTLRTINSKIRTQQSQSIFAIQGKYHIPQEAKSLDQSQYPLRYTKSAMVNHHKFDIKLKHTNRKIIKSCKKKILENASAIFGEIPINIQSANNVNKFRPKGLRVIHIPKVKPKLSQNNSIIKGINIFSSCKNKVK